MTADDSIRFFDAQFQRQLIESDFRLNPFEQDALDHLSGHVLDYGCGLGNLAIAAARKGCRVLALDASHAAVEHVRHVAQAEALQIEAAQADLRRYALEGEFDAVVCIGLLMFFDCPTAFARLRDLQMHVRPGGIAVVNVLVEGTTYQEMFDPSEHCLFARSEIQRRFAGWEILRSEFSDFPAPHDQVKSFQTLVARKPETRGAA